MKVLSLFDGISCGRVALERAGLCVSRYVAYEIDQDAINVSAWNWEDIEHKGSVEGADFSQYKGFDIVIGGSPCQGFSLAGKQLNFEDPRSKLFFEFARAVDEIKPRYFLLENVVMKKPYQDIITSYLGVEPIEINSALLSAQNRKRLYWTNIPSIEQPDDLGIVLSDIIQSGNVDKQKSYAIDANYSKGTSLDIYFNRRRRQIVFGAAMRGRYVNNGKSQQFIYIRKDDKANALTLATKNSLCVEVGKAEGINGHDILKRIYSPEGKSPTLTANTGGNQFTKIAVNAVEWRKLTPVECERLQTLPDGYTEMVSDTQRYRQLGNGWTVDVIAYIFNHIHLDYLL